MDTHQGKKIWVIGASSGIGLALACELSRQGAHLILSARREKKLMQLNSQLGGEHTVLALDVSDALEMTKAAQSIVAIDSVIFMPALYAPHSDKTKDISLIHDMIAVNLGGAFNTVNAVLPMFEAQNSGQIVLCASVAGYRGLPYGQPYCATKAALINYAESLKIELEIKNIDVKVINPGFVKTPLTDKNDFPMPMMIKAEQAAIIISKELLTSKFEIHFPKNFTLLMKGIRALPTFLYFPLARIMRKKTINAS